MTDSPKKRSVLITGIGKPGQLGATLLQAFADNGYAVHAVGRTLPDVEALTAETRQRGGDAHAFAADLADEDQVGRLMAEVGEMTNGRLDALINGAGKFVQFGSVAEGSLDAWQQNFSDNLTSAFLATRGSLPMLRAARGSIVYIASVAALASSSPAGMAPYSAAKAALLKLMRAVADEEHGTVRANAIAPGGINTAVMLAAVGNMPGLVTREDLAAKAIYLAGPDSGDTTGQVIPM